MVGPFRTKRPVGKIASEKKKPAQQKTSQKARKERFRAFIEGRITLADLEGVTKKQLYEWAELGYAELVAGRSEQARAVFEGLHSLDPYDAYFISALGSIAHQAGDLREAETRYSRALEINPFAPFALAHRGEIRIMTGKLELGVKDLLRAVEEDPKATDPAVQRARFTIAILVKQLRDAGIDASALEERGSTEKVQKKRPPAGPLAPPELPTLSKDQLSAFADSSEFVVRRKPIAAAKTPAPKKPDPRRPR